MERGAAVPNCTGPAQIRKICVFCGSRAGNRPAYGAAAGELGREMVKRSVGLVYGGGTVGLMGRLAKTVVKGLGTDAVVGVIPTSLNLVELSGEMIGDTRVVDDMHERKRLMANEADAFIALPGGFGTLEELMEIITWQQLSIHSKPVGLLNIEGFFDKLLQFFDHLVDEGFVAAECRNNLITADDPGALIDLLSAFQGGQGNRTSASRGGSVDPNLAVLQQTAKE